MKLIIYALLLFITQITYAKDLPPEDLMVVDNYVNKKSAELKAGESTRTFMGGDLNRDSVEDLAVLYTLVGIGGMGGNSVTSFLAIFKRTSNGLEWINETKVGGASTRILSFESIIDGVITFNSKFYLPPDARCCPTGNGKVFYKLSRNIVRELNVAPRS